MKPNPKSCNIIHFVALAPVFAVLFLFQAYGAVSGERQIRAEEIYRLLSNARVSGKGFEQTFGDPRGHDSASTTYWQGKNASFGRWRVDGDRYCSQWPPSPSWSCYKMAISEENGETNIVWIDSSGRRFEGILNQQ